MTKQRRFKIMVMFWVWLSLFSLTACQDTNPTYEDIQGFNSGLDTIIDESTYTQKKANLITDDEEDFVESPLNDFKAWNTAYVVFENGEAHIENEVENTEIYMQDGNLIVDSTQKMTLVLEGTLNGSIVVHKTDGKLKLVLNGVQITANSGPAINLQTEKRVFLVIEDDTVNNLTDANDHPLMPNGSKTKAALFSEEQLIISGHGELNITSLYQHGIASDDYIKILSGQINILSAIADGLRANDYIVIDGGMVSINASGDGIEVERGYIVVNGGKIDITAEKHGIKALYDIPSLTIKPFIDINHGVIHITSKEQGITSNRDINLNDGALIVSSVGDAISAAKEITIHKGIYYLTSSEKQPLDGTQGVKIMGGTVILVSQGDEPSIKSNDGPIIFNGGTIVAVGALDVVINEASQGYLKYGNVIKNEILHIQGESILMTIAFLESYNHVIVSSAQMTSDDTYEIYTGGTIQGDNFYGLYFEGTYENGTLKKTIKAN